MPPKTQIETADLATHLRGLSRDELRVHAKNLGVKAFQAMRKEELVEALLKLDAATVLRRLNEHSSDDGWWAKYHNHIYGVATVVALFFALFAYWYPLPPIPPKDPTPKSILAAMHSLPLEERETYFDEYFDGKKIRIYGKITGGMSLAGPAGNGLSVMTGCTSVFACEDGALVWVLFDESQRELVESLQADTPGAGVIEATIDGCAIGSDKPISVDADTTNILPFGEEASDVVLLRQGSFPEITPVIKR